MTLRKYLAFVTVWLLATTLATPFAHVHPGDAAHHHSNGLSHAHLAVHHHGHHDDAEGAEWEDLDENEQAVWLDWAPTEQPRVEIIAAEGVARFELAPQVLATGAVLEFTPRSHDPPSSRLLPARSPPV